ncbi:MAG: MerR family transcriptional regulator [Chloroflexota bacterium]
MPEPLTIGALAKLAGATPKAVRHYERLGLLQPASRGDNRYRYYGEAHVQQLRFIRRTQRLGLTLTEIGRLMDLARQARCNELRAALDQLLAQKIRGLELKIAVLSNLRRELHPEEAGCACRSFVPDCDCLPVLNDLSEELLRASENAETSPVAVDRP